jgi:DNA-binding transcriptional LysR family regulator
MARIQRKHSGRDVITFKQLEALYWCSKLKSFANAASRLHTSQSAVSKRIAELEQVVGEPVIDRSTRGPKLTTRGQELFDGAEKMLLLRDTMLTSLGRAPARMKRFRLGVTELTALTWLPQLVKAMRAAYPDMALEPEIDLSPNLCDKLARGEIDLVIVPPVFAGKDFVALPLRELQLAWMCAPDLLPERKSFSMTEIAVHPILMQAGRSGVDVAYDQWFREQGIAIRRVYTGNSLVALSALTMAGFGVGYLPTEYFSDLVKHGLLRVLNVRGPQPSDTHYHAVHRQDAMSTVGEVARMAQALCNFEKPKLPRRRPRRAGAA